MYIKILSIKEFGIEVRLKTLNCNKTLCTHELPGIYKNNYPKGR